MILGQAAKFPFAAGATSVTSADEAYEELPPFDGGTVPTGGKLVVVAILSHFGTGSSGITAPTYGGTPMTYVDDDARGTAPNPRTILWVLDDAPQGAQAWSLAKNSPIYGHLSFVSLECDDGAAVAAYDTGGSNGTGSNPSVSGVAALAAGDWWFAALASDADDVPSAQSGTKIHDHDFGTEISAHQMGIAASAATQTINWTLASSGTARTGFIINNPGDPPDGPAATRKVKVGGAFAEKPALTKVGGAFIETPVVVL